MSGSGTERNCVGTQGIPELRQTGRNINLATTAALDPFRSW
jgi:hypothetical protein